MKILFVQKVKAIAGSEKYFLGLIPELEKRGIQTEFVCVYNKNDKEKTLEFIKLYEHLHFKIHTIEVKSDKSIFKTLRKIRSLYLNGNFDLVHSHLIHADLWCTLLKRMLVIKCPIVSTKHGYEEKFISENGFNVKALPNNLYYKICRFSEKKITLSFAVSEGLKKLFIESNICSSGEIRTIHHGFDLAEINHAPNLDYRFSEYQSVLLGRIIPFKGHMLALQSLLIIKETIPEVKLLIIGDGDENLINELKAFVINNELQTNVEFLGFKNNIYDYLRNSDLMFVTSIAEGFGLIFLEAMNAHLPIIGFDVPATNEIIEDQITGELVSPFNTSEMAVKAIDIFKNKAKKEKYASNAKLKLLSYFTLERMVDETIQFYNDSLNL